MQCVPLELSFFVLKFLWEKSVLGTDSIGPEVELRDAQEEGSW